MVQSNLMHSILLVDQQSINENSFDDNWGVNKVKGIGSQLNERDRWDNAVCRVDDDSKHEQKLLPGV
jgi:hypothetical protein